MNLFENYLGFPDPVIMLVVLCASAFLLTVLLLTIGWLLPKAYDFVNDEDKGTRNWLADAIMRLFGKHWSFNCMDYRDKNSNYCGELTDAVLHILMTGTVSPIVVLFSLWFYPVVLFLVTSVAIMFGLRTIVRYKKLFEAHVKDMNAHKEN